MDITVVRCSPKCMAVLAYNASSGPSTPPNLTNSHGKLICIPLKHIEYASALKIAASNVRSRSESTMVPHIILL